MCGHCVPSIFPIQFQFVVFNSLTTRPATTGYRHYSTYSTLLDLGMTPFFGWMHDLKILQCLCEWHLFNRLHDYLTNVSSPRPPSPLVGWDWDELITDWLLWHLFVSLLQDLKELEDSSKEHERSPGASHVGRVNTSMWYRSTGLTWLSCDCWRVACKVSLLWIVKIQSKWKGK